MAIISNNLLQDYLKIDENFILNIGNFDGIHTGHQQILLKTFDLARENSYKKALITFCNKPAALFESNFINTQIFPISSKLRYFEKIGIDYIFLFEFNSNLKNITAEEFLHFLSSNKFLKEIVIGENFVFGKDKKGDTEVLKKYFEDKNVRVNVVPLVYKKGQLISSTMIRQHILSGDFCINDYLIEPFYILGLVEAGKHYGRLIQFPTANIYIYDQIRPKPAVYATITKYKFEKYLNSEYDYSMTYVGEKGDIETNIFDKTIDLYNKEIQVYFIKYIRDNVKIQSLAHLEFLLKIDKNNIKEFYNRYFDAKMDAREFLKRISRSQLDV